MYTQVHCFVIYPNLLMLVFWFFSIIIFFSSRIFICIFYSFHFSRFLICLPILTIYPFTSLSRFIIACLKYLFGKSSIWVPFRAGAIFLNMGHAFLCCYLFDNIWLETKCYRWVCVDFSLFLFFWEVILFLILFRDEAANTHIFPAG